MAQSVSATGGGVPWFSSRVGARPAHQAYLLLHLAVTVAPILAGLDKFFDILAKWDMYLAPAVERMLPFPAHTFMMLIGIVEIIAGGLVLWKPRIGAPIVGVWLLGIVINLLMSGGWYDIALRDFGLSLGAFALWRLAAEFDRRTEVR